MKTGKYVNLNAAIDAIPKLTGGFMATMHADGSADVEYVPFRASKFWRFAFRYTPLRIFRWRKG